MHDYMPLLTQMHLCRNHAAINQVTSPAILRSLHLGLALSTCAVTLSILIGEPNQQLVMSQVRPQALDLVVAAVYTTTVGVCTTDCQLRHAPVLVSLKLQPRRAPHPDTQPIDAFNIMPGQNTILPINHQPRVGSGGSLSTLSGKHHGHYDDAKCGVYKGRMLFVKHQICAILKA